MRSIFRYPGGKTRREVREWIISHRPAGITEYREPFVGGGGIFFATTPKIRRWVNDFNSSLVAVYLALRDRPNEFIQSCRAIPSGKPNDPQTEAGPRGGVAVNARLQAVFDSVAFDDKADPAFRYFFVNRTVFGGRVNYDIPSRLYFSNPDGWNIVDSGALEHAAKLLANVEITCGDFAPLLEKPGEDVWVYCDPPYVVNTGFTKSSQLYQHGFTEDDHRRFAEAVRQSPHKVCVSYDDDEAGFVRSLFPEPDFRIVTKRWAYSGTTNEEKEYGKELLILNYDPPRTLVTAFDPPTNESLTKLERAELGRCEEIIASGLRSFVETGEALRTIRNGRLYREELPTFELYCKRRWGMGRNYSNKLIRSAEVVLGLGTIVPILPATESQARELSRLEQPGQQLTVWQRVIARCDDPTQITARLVREEVDKELPPVEPVPTDWRKSFARIWGQIAPDERDAARSFLESLMGATMETVQ